MIVKSLKNYTENYIFNSVSTQQADFDTKYL